MSAPLLVAGCSCDGSGRVHNPETGNMKPCACWPVRTALLAREKANIDIDYLDATFEVFEPRQEYPNQQYVLDYCRAYADQWPAVKAEGRCLAILGQRASMGKSHLATSVCLSLIEKHWTVSVADQDVCLFVNVMNWFMSIRLFADKFPTPAKGSPTWDDLMENVEYRRERDRLARFDQRMLSTELLILDDLTRFDPTPSRLDRLYNVVNHRVSNRLPIIITDNLPSWDKISEKLGADYGPPIVDRLRRNGDTLVVETPMSKKKTGGKKK